MLLKLFISAIIFFQFNTIFAQSSQKRIRSKSKNSATKTVRRKSVNEVSFVKGFEDFKDIAVIQKRFFPKQNRLNADISAIGFLNNRMTSQLGLKLHLGYNFTDRWSAELDYFNVGASDREPTKNLNDNFRVVTTDLVIPKQLIGAKIKFSPIYGKISLMNKTITPFEFFFFGGGGMMTTDEDETVPVLHLGVGQNYPFTKDLVLRWDIGIAPYQANSKQGVVGSQANTKVTQSLIYFSLGLSFYFPGVSSR